MQQEVLATTIQAGLRAYVCIIIVHCSFYEALIYTFSWLDPLHMSAEQEHNW